MGKSHHKSRKRRRSPSADRLTGLERKMSRLIDILSEREVRAPSRRPTPSPRSPPAPQEVLGSRNERESDLSSDSEAILVPLARQEGLTDPEFAAAEEDISNRGEANLEQPKQVTIDESALSTISVSGADKTDSLTKQLFGSDMEGEETAQWNDTVTQKLRDLTRKGLAADQRESLFKKYIPPETLTFLRAPVLNQECKVALKNNSIVKRDDFASKNQAQAGLALCALGEAISDFLKPEIQSSLSPGACLVVTKVTEGAKLLADHFYRLSLNRRAQITPALNLNAKNTADAIPVDDLLFGASFGDQIKNTVSIEKSSKEIIKQSVTITKRIQQPQ